MNRSLSMAVLLYGTVCAGHSALGDNPEGQQSQEWIGRTITFKTAERAPAQFDAWTFFWKAPKLQDVKAKIDYVVILPNSKEHFVYSNLHCEPGGVVRSDFCAGMPGGDVAPFQGQDLRVMFRATPGQIKFSSRYNYSFAFYKKNAAGKIPWQTPFKRMPAEVVVEGQPGVSTHSVAEQPKSVSAGRPSVVNTASRCEQPEGTTANAMKVPCLNNVGVGNKDNVFIVPTAESDGATQDKIHKYVVEIKNRFYKQAEIISDIDALKRDLSQNTIIVYGTPTGNLWLAKHISLLPVAFDKESVIVGKKTYRGMNLRLISVMRNPTNPQMYARIHTAQRSEDVVGINSVFHGPTSWVVARGTEIEDQGDYYVLNNEWTSDPAAVGLKAPKIVRMDPADGASAVDPVTTKELRVTFDQPMANGYAWCQKSNGECPSSPKGAKAYWSDDGTTCSLPVELKSGVTYKIYLNLWQYTSFRSKDGVPLKSVLYSFSTAGNAEKAVCGMGVNLVSKDDAVTVAMRDGTQYVGDVVSKDDTSLMLRTNTATMTIAWRNVTVETFKALHPDLYARLKAKTEAAAKAKAEQAAKADTKKRAEAQMKMLPAEKTLLKSGIVLRLIPAGVFIMGSPTSEADRNDNEVQHKVTISKPFYMGKYEVTQGQWRKVTRSILSGFENIGKNGPAETLSWNECQEFIRDLEGFEGLPKGSLRLPTEAEWEYACRAGTQTAFCYGNHLDRTMAHFQVEGDPKPVGSFKPNAWGLYDMHGNVSEWCQDWFGDYCGDATDPSGPESASYRVIRGGSWADYAGHCRSACRSSGDPGHAYFVVGFRVVLPAGQ